MKVRVIEKFPGDWEHEDFPIYPMGTPVILGEEDTHYENWFDCTIEGRESFVPSYFISDGKLNRDYNPTELIQEVGDILEVKQIVNAWLLATNQNGITAWIPAEVVISVEPGAQIIPEVQINTVNQIAPEPQAVSEVQVNPMTQVSPEVEMAPEAQVTSEVQVNPMTQVSPEVEMTPEIQTTSEAQVNPMTQVSPEVEMTPENQTDSTAQVNSEV